MIPLLKMYDDFTSNKYVSLGATVVSTTFMVYKTFTFECWRNPSIFVISACAGIAFALLSKSYLEQNGKVKSEGEKSSIYATLSLFFGFAPVGRNAIYQNIFEKNMQKLLGSFGCQFCPKGFLYGFGVGFLATTLVIRLMNGQTKFKFQSPFVFE